MVQSVNNQDFIFKQEYYATRLFLRNSIPSNAKIIRVSSSTHASGQINISNFFLDLHVVTQEDSEITTIKLVQYNSSFCHGCISDCPKKYKFGNPVKRKKTEETLEKLKKIASIWIAAAVEWKILPSNNTLNIEVLEITDCQYEHKEIRKLSHPSDLLLTDKVFNFNKTTIKYSSYIKKILNNDLEGFVVVKDLQIASKNLNPHLGFCIQRFEVEPKHYSQKMREQYKKANIKDKSRNMIVGLNSFVGIKTIHTAYLRYIIKKFSLNF